MIFLFQKRNSLLRDTLSVIPRELDYKKTSPDWNTFIVSRIISNKLINILKKMITFNQFLTLIEGKKKPRLPPNVVDGTYREDEEGNKEYTLAPHTGPTKPFKKPKDVTAEINNQGGTGRKAIENVIKQREKELRKKNKNKVDEGFSIKNTQRELERKRKEAKERREKEAEQRNNAARNAFRHEGGMVSYEKDPKTGKVVRGRRTKDGFTPDT
jgi:hypothetical protein